KTSRPTGPRRRRRCSSRRWPAACSERWTSCARASPASSSATARTKSCSPATSSTTRRACARSRSPPKPAAAYHRGMNDELPGERLIAADATREDEALEASIRPRRLDEYLGQAPVREQLGIYIEAARRRGEAMDHVLIFGPPGLGKTTLSHVIANELGVGLRVTSGPVIEKAGDLAALLTNLQPRDVLFIDEIHRLSPVVEEVLYPAMEDFQIDIMIGEGPAARSIKLDLPPFTLVGATTRAGLLTAPLRDRF